MQEETAFANFAPRYLAKEASNSVVFGPVPSQKDFRVSATAVCSTSSIDGDPKIIKSSRIVFSKYVNTGLTAAFSLNLRVSF